MTFEDLKEELKKVGQLGCTLEGNEVNFTVYKRETEVIEVVGNSMSLACNGLDNVVIFKVTKLVTEYLTKNDLDKRKYDSNNAEVGNQDTSKVS